MSCVGREADLFSSPLFIRRGHSADHPGFILSVIIIDLVSTFLTFSLFVCHPAHDLVMSLNQIWRDGSIKGDLVDVFSYETHWVDIFACSGEKTNVETLSIHPSISQKKTWGSVKCSPLPLNKLLRGLLFSVSFRVKRQLYGDYRAAWIGVKWMTQSRGQQLLYS